MILAFLVRALTRSRLRHFNDEALIVWARSVNLLWALMFAFVSSQNFGTAVRCRGEILPMLLGSLLYLGRVRTPALPNQVASDNA